MCANRAALRIGTTTFSVTVAATQPECGASTEPSSVAMCVEGGGMPPLSPGPYYARLYRFPSLHHPNLGASPEPIPVRVTRS